MTNLSKSTANMWRVNKSEYFEIHCLINIQSRTFKVALEATLRNVSRTNRIMFAFPILYG